MNDKDKENEIAAPDVPCQLGEPLMHGPQPYRWCTTHNRLLLTCEAAAADAVRQARRETWQAAIKITRARLDDVPETVDFELDRNAQLAGYSMAAGSIKAALERALHAEGEKGEGNG